jgi:hypothetical protein
MALETRYVRYEVSESGSLSTSRLYNGIRRIDVSLPAVLVAELDRNILEFGYYVSRSSVIEVAIRQFLDRGGVTGPAPARAYR